MRGYVLRNVSVMTPIVNEGQLKERHVDTSKL